jgi:hypothetical protein
VLCKHIPQISSLALCIIGQIYLRAAQVEY